MRGLFKKGGNMVIYHHCNKGSVQVYHRRSPLCNYQVEYLRSQC